VLGATKVRLGNSELGWDRFIRYVARAFHDQLAIDLAKIPDVEICSYHYDHNLGVFRRNVMEITERVANHQTRLAAYFVLDGEVMGNVVVCQAWGRDEELNRRRFRTMCYLSMIHLS